MTTGITIAAVVVLALMVMGSLTGLLILTLFLLALASAIQGNIILAVILFYLAGLMADLAGGGKKIIL